MEVPVFATDLLRGLAFPDEIVWSVPVCQCEPILLWRIRADDSVRAHLYHRNQLHDGNIVYRRNSLLATVFLPKLHHGRCWLQALLLSESDINHLLRNDTFVLLCQEAVLCHSRKLR